MRGQHQLDARRKGFRDRLARGLDAELLEMFETACTFAAVKRRKSTGRRSPSRRGATSRSSPTSRGAELPGSRMRKRLPWVDLRLQEHEVAAAGGRRVPHDHSGGSRERRRRPRGRQGPDDQSFGPSRRARVASDLQRERSHRPRTRAELQTSPGTVRQHRLGRLGVDEVDPPVDRRTRFEGSGFAALAEMVATSSRRSPCRQHSCRDDAQRRRSARCVATRLTSTTSAPRTVPVRPTIITGRTCRDRARHPRRAGHCQTAFGDHDASYHGPSGV